MGVIWLTYLVWDKWMLLSGCCRMSIPVNGNDFDPFGPTGFKLQDLFFEIFVSPIDSIVHIDSQNSRKCFRFRISEDANARIKLTWFHAKLLSSLHNV